MPDADPPVDQAVAAGRRLVHAACPHDCPDTCAMHVTVEGDRAVALTGDPTHPFTRGFLCTKVSRYLERVYSPDRVLYPMRRVGKKGEGRFERVSWDDALRDIAARLKAIAEGPYGPQAILPYSYSGTLGLVQEESLPRRFFHRLGASLLGRTICSAAGGEGIRATIGASVGTDPEAVVRAKLIILWGTNTITSNVHLWRVVLDAREKGARLVAIDPWQSRTAAHCDEHLAIRPGTDAALALGLMHVLFAEGLADREYLAAYTEGAADLEARAREYDPARVADICGVPAERIVALARAYATTRPAFIRINYGLQRHAGGGMAVRTISCLPAVSGSWRDSGGGLLLSTSGAFPIDRARLARTDWIRPGTRTINMIEIGRALTNRDGRFDPPIKALFVYGSNPAAVAPNAALVHEGLAREDLFTVVHEQFQTDTADYADYLLPATTQLEQFDLHRAYGHYYLVLNEPAIPPRGEAVSNTELFRRLSRAMGFDDPDLLCDDRSIAAGILAGGDPAFEGITLETLAERGWQRLSRPGLDAPFREGGFPTRSGKALLVNPDLAKQGLDPVPTYIPPVEATSPTPELPLALLTPPAHHFLNSSFSAIPSLRKAVGDPTVEIHPDDAAARGVADGTMVRVRNERGWFLARAVVTDRVRPGLVVAPSIHWNKLVPGGRNANWVTADGTTDMGGGPIFYDVRVEVEPA
ncbi:MAG TPA: molybdopterin oxidoreductase family protein [Thermodesulfobacteriota bacterium]